MIMYKLNMPIINESNEKLPTIKQLFKEIFGYTEEEIQQFIKSKFMCAVVQNLTLETAQQIAEIFYDNDIRIYLSKQENETPIVWGRDLGISLTKNPPKEHYCDEPLVSREHLVNPLAQQEQERLENYVRQSREEIIQRNSTPTITCPYCKSTDCKKISGLSKAGSVALWGIFALGKTTKQFHCNSCKADF